jgi:putative oxidoreductase
VEKWLGRYGDVIYTALRVVVGLLFACHGAQKILGALGGHRATDAQGTIAGAIELGGGLLIAVGLLTGFAAFLASGLMAFAYFMVHAQGGFWPILNKGELAVVYCFLFLYSASRGSGPYGLDAMMRRRGH